MIPENVFRQMYNKYLLSAIIFETVLLEVSNDGQFPLHFPLSCVAQDQHVGPHDFVFVQQVRIVLACWHLDSLSCGSGPTRRGLRHRKVVISSAFQPTGPCLTFLQRPKQTLLV